MNDTLKQTLKLLPSLPGCYIYYNKEGEVIYVGKAKILKRRVMSISTENTIELKLTFWFHKLNGWNILLQIPKLKP